MESAGDIGGRIRQARRLAGLSLRELAARAEVSAQAISKYERGLDLPSSGVLLRLARALGVRVEFFLRPRSIPRIVPAFRKRCSLPRKQEASLLASIQDWLERSVEVERLLTLDRHGFAMPEGFSYPVASLEEVERAAVALRHAWQIGLDPIEDLTELLEDRGIKVGTVDAHDDFDACTFWAEADGGFPVIVLKRALPGDRQRFNLAHELGHLLLHLAEPLDSEKVAHRFAGAFLAPAAAVRAELGERRQTLDLYELHLLKHKYGLSMQAWIYRAKDLGILSEAGAAQLFQRFRAQCWHKIEPGDGFPPEQPKRLERLVMHALAEDVISETRAAELLGKPLREFLREVAEQHGGLPVDMRNGR